ncbi:MAG: hypothetical protein P8K81_01500 [Flavobacteriales bacterium]|nr:hypothetical protein [Flavobacteriales bacterium]
MMNHLLGCTVSTVMVIACLILGLIGCDQHDSLDFESQPVSMEDLVQLNAQKAKTQKALADSLIVQWGWNSDSSFVDLPSGLKIVYREKTGASSNSLGDSVYWNVRVALIDSTTIMEWRPNNPLVFHRDFSMWPSGFHDVASMISTGDSVECLLPPHLAWGLTGQPPHVPQDAMIWLQIRAMPSKGADSAWMKMIANFESGNFQPDPAWLKSPELVGAPFLVWADQPMKLLPRDLRIGESVKIRMRTMVVKDDVNEPVDLGWNEWSFVWGAEGQCLPLLEDLMVSRPNLSRWECWCPVSLAFGSSGLLQAGIEAADVVGFQWEIQRVEEV